MNFVADTPRLEIFRVAGIPVKVDITFALVPLFLFGTFEQSPLVFAVLVVAVFLSVLLHELGHATFARLFAVPVGEILVGGFYGYARMLRSPPSKLANIIILLAGPLTNGLIFLLCWNALGQPDIGPTGRFGPIAPAPWLADSPWKLQAVWTLAGINLAMLVFNLLPAFPLDGGRIYRDVLSAILPQAGAVRVIALLGVLVGVWSAFMGLRISLVMLLIGAQIAIINWSILKAPGNAKNN
ncbi:site-2 protease family protein [Hyphomicrobium sp.]|uniref:site-2 protease family protein n=1 Tax=Hyphomicrobium sp. TaxID=82 RepID=UPI000FABE5C9|nr:site-2 protease family protein [Hyphomicrobium sp.]MBN9246858.1 M50 family metallopeptidase [Hyphomicrobium sp.]RUP08361.1 MAG: peptidase M50 [Hyphomicrobium sp.]